MGVKFRLPWLKGNTTYLDGKIYFQVWQKINSTETRLVPNGKIKKYDNTAYEEKMFNFNSITRKKYYNHDVKCYGHCYDCRSEVEIIKNYLIKIRNIDDKYVNECICYIGREISKVLGKLLFDNDTSLSKYNI